MLSTLSPLHGQGWLRRATAELRLIKVREALESLRRGWSCAGKTARLKTSKDAALGMAFYDEMQK